MIGDVKQKINRNGKGREWEQKGMRREGTGIGRDEYEGM